MSDNISIEKLQFLPLKTDGSNYLGWSRNMGRLLKSKGLYRWIDSNIEPNDGNDVEQREYDTTLYEVWGHIDNVHKEANCDLESLFELWDKLRTTYEGLATAKRPLVTNQWQRVKITDYKTVAEYISEIYRLVARMKEVGGLESECTPEALITKTIESFPDDCWQYGTVLRDKEYTTFEDFVNRLFDDEGFNESRSRDLFGRTFVNSIKSNPPNSNGNDNSTRSLTPARDTAPNIVESFYAGNTEVTCRRCIKKNHTADVCFTDANRIKHLKEKKGSLRSAGHSNRGYHQTAPKLRDPKPSAYFTELDPNLFREGDDDVHTGFEVNSYMIADEVTGDLSKILVDNGTTTSIFKDKGIFRTLQLFSDPASITTVGGEEAICEGFGPVRIEIAGELVIDIPRAVFAPNSRGNILAESDIRQNGYEIKTNRNGMVIFEDYNNGMDRLLIPRLKNGLYETSFNRWEVLSHLVDEDAVLPDEFNLWHRRLAHPTKSTMVHMIQHETLANTPFKHAADSVVVMENLIGQDGGKLEPSKSPLAANLFFVTKNDSNQELRPCIDYRDLNSCTVDEIYPMPSVQELVQKMVGGNWYAKVDLRKAYNQLRVKEGQEWKLAFKCHLGTFQPKVMPFGPKTAPATMQRFVNDTFRKQLDEGWLINLLDDFYICTTGSVEEHMKHIREILDVMRKKSLFPKQSKCVWFNEGD
ncbi:hypothetical protein SeLEV6574_g03676 [Synchytrium endobioticum]|uniref:Reverse transcriptase domain-containing protein n=1 Tax=Synchytrium endobioticum TaxID=286115 RepID=A0A507D2S7_9FUNG|nr:hypothetical protein SeLEV6574_g03676 [Synchytrium endobioticum]